MSRSGILEFQELHRGIGFVSSEFILRKKLKVSKTHSNLGDGATEKPK